MEPMKKIDIPPRLYPCCTKPDCKTYTQVLDFLKTWGLPTTQQKDGKSVYFSLELPDYWHGWRKTTFATAIKNVKTKH